MKQESGNRSAVLLLSGGLDSGANLVLGSEGPRPFRVRVALTVDYGQRGAAREIGRAKALAGHFGVEHVVFGLPGFSELVGGAAGALLGAADVPRPESLDDLAITRKSAAAVWVPNRNGVLLSIAAALAESRGIDAVAVGFNAEEAVTFPDNTPEYMGAMTAALGFSTANEVQVLSATAGLTKQQTVRRLADHGFPFALLWSCYLAGEKHCGECESCQRLRRAVREGLPGLARDAALSGLFGAEDAALSGGRVERC